MQTMKMLKLTFTSMVLSLSFFNPFSEVSASDSKDSKIIYKKALSKSDESKLIEDGGKLFQALYKSPDIKSANVDPLSVLTEKGKKSGLLKGKDVTLALKKSKGSEEEKAKRREDLARIIAMSWKVAAIGKKEAGNPTSISYKIVDKDGKFYQYLLGYEQFANKMSSSFAYDRNPAHKKSSHYKDVSPESQYGIDIRFYASQKSLNLLPLKKAHILFGKLVIGAGQPNLLFLKFESHGISALSETVRHGIALIKSRMRSKKDLQQQRIERIIPDTIGKLYISIVEKLPKAEQAKYFNQGSTIRGMILALRELSAANSQYADDEKNFVEQLKKQYPNDGSYLQWRTGNEIIIDMSKYI